MPLLCKQRFHNHVLTTQTNHKSTHAPPKRDAAKLVGVPCLAVVAAACAFTSSPWASAVLLLMLASTLLQLGGAMYLAGIQVNAGELCWRWEQHNRGHTTAPFPPLFFLVPAFFCSPRARSPCVCGETLTSSPNLT